MQPLWKLSFLAFAVVAVAQDPDDDYGGEDGGDYGGEEPPPPGSSTQLTSVEQMESFLDDPDSALIGTFTAEEIIDPSAKQPDGWDDEEDGEWVAPTVPNPDLVSFKSVTGMLSGGYRVAYTVDSAVMAALKAKPGGLYLYRSKKFLADGERPRERFPSGHLTESAVQNWLKAKAMPLVGMFSSMTKERYALPTLVIFVRLSFDANAKGVNYVLKRAKKVAMALQGKVSVALADLDESSFDLDNYGLTSKSKTDVLMGLWDPKGHEYYGKEGGFSAANLEAFAQDFLAGKLTPHVKPPRYIPSQGGPNPACPFLRL